MLAIYRSGRAIISKTPTRLTTIYIPTWGYLREPLSRTHRIPARFRASWRVLSKTETITPTCSLSIPTGIIRQFSGSQMDGTIWRATWRPAQAPAAPAIGSSPAANHDNSQAWKGYASLQAAPGGFGDVERAAT